MTGSTRRPDDLPGDSCSEELTAVAVAVARRRGQLQDASRVEGIRSSSGGASYVLLDGRGVPLARLPSDAVQEQLQRRRARLTRLFQRLRRAADRRGSASANWRTELRSWSWEKRALVWALSAHQPVPQPVFGLEQLLLLAVLLLLGVLPGVVYLGWLLLQRSRYDRELRALVNEWRSRGRPDPVERGLPYLLSGDPSVRRSDS